MYPSIRNTSVTAIALAGLGLIWLGAAHAQSSLLLTTNETCTGINCNALEIRGALSGTGTNINNPRSVPWIAQVSAIPNKCIRFDVVASTADFLEMTVISPNNGVRTVGFIQNPNQPNNNCCPKVIVGSVPKGGFYTVILNENGGGPVNGSFRLKFQTYNTGNPNCANPTPES